MCIARQTAGKKLSNQGTSSLKVHVVMLYVSL